jgi:hypothetical protein
LSRHTRPGWAGSVSSWTLTLIEEEDDTRS